MPSFGKAVGLHGLILEVSHIPRKHQSSTGKVSRALLLHLIVSFDTGITGSAIGQDKTDFCKTVCVFIETTALILDELALPKLPVHMGQSSSAAIEVDTRELKSLVQGFAGLPCVVMRDLAGDVVQDVGFRDRVVASSHAGMLPRPPKSWRLSVARAPRGKVNSGARL